MTKEKRTKGRRIGYGRVSTSDQRLDLQLQALEAADCDLIFSDRGVSGGRAQRPGLDKALASLREGDTLVVYKTDRLGRSVEHLACLLARINRDGVRFYSLTEGTDTETPGGRFAFHVYAAAAQMLREQIRENTVAGLKAAKARGTRLGRPRCLTDADIHKARLEFLQDSKTACELAEKYNVSVSTIRRYLAQLHPKAVAS